MKLEDVYQITVKLPAACKDKNLIMIEKMYTHIKGNYS